MACLLLPKCKFLHSFFRCKLPTEVVDVEVKITSMQGTHIFKTDQTTQVIKCTPWSTRLCPHPTIQPANSDPHYQIPTPILERTMLQRRGKEQHPRDSGLQHPSLLPHVCLYQRPHLNPKMMHQAAGSHLQFQFQFVRAPHGLVQSKCQATYLKIGTGYFCQTI